MPESLRGIILRDEGAELVIRATPTEVAQFTRGGARDVIVARGRMTQTAAYAASVLAGERTPRYDIRPGTVLYDGDGIEAVLVRDVSYGRPQIDITSFGGVTDRYVLGRTEVLITAVGL